jgi:dynein heavy chain
MIKLDKGCAIFITMNPGYAGRSELPDNLKSLFRPVAMMTPDLGMICEIMLVSEGFKDFKVLAKKMVTLYQMMMQQMSKQDHYDFGLRNIKSVLNCAGNLKRAGPDDPEQMLLMRAINDMNLPKWIAQDIPLYQALLTDMFPGVELPEANYGKLEEAIKAVLLENKLQVTAVAVGKTIQVFETKQTRHGNMLLGASCAGKSVSWRSLQEAKTMLAKQGVPDFEKVHTFILNPKSITMDELYGAFDLQTMSGPTVSSRPSCAPLARTRSPTRSGSSSTAPSTRSGSSR